VDNISIPLPRPRSVRSLQKDPAYHELYAKVWSRLEFTLDTNAQALST